MKAIYVASTMPFVGKNVVSVGLIRRLQKMGKKVGYFKPFGRLATEHQGKVTDSDAIFFKKALGLPDALEDICPVVINDEAAAEIYRGADIGAKRRVLDAFGRVAEGKDVLVCLGMGSLFTGLAAGFCTLDFCDAVDASVLLVDRFAFGLESVNGVLGAKRMMGERLAGIVYNRVNDASLSLVANAVAPFLEGRGIPVFGSLPDDPMLGAVPIGVIAQELPGRVLCGGDHLEELVQGFTIGAMQVQAALRFLRHSKGHAVITGGDRHDIQLAALEAGAKCLILTGDLYPNERLLTRAEESGTPVILVPHDTAATISACESLGHQLGLNSMAKIDRAQEICAQHVEYDKLLPALGAAPEGCWPPTE